MMVPFIVILPGLLALGLLDEKILPESEVAARGSGYSYNDVLPLMMARYFGPGLLGLGITALIAGFMAGMAGNVSAFATVWTYDIYRAFMNKNASDAHYVSMGRWCTIIGIFVSIGTAYLVMQFSSIMDYVQALFSFFIAPLFGTVLLGMLWKRATPAGGFWGLLAGTVSSIAMWFWVYMRPGSPGLCGALASRQADGREHVPRALVVDHLRCCDRGRQPRDHAQARRRAGGPGLRLHADPFRAAHAPVAAADLLGRCRRRGLCCLERDLLVRKQTP